MPSAFAYATNNWFFREENGYAVWMEESAPEEDDYVDPGDRAVPTELHGSRSVHHGRGRVGHDEYNTPMSSWQEWELRPLEVMFAWPPYMRGERGEARIREVASHE